MNEERHHLWKLLWDYDPNGLIVVDPDLYIHIVNPAFCRMFGTESQNLIGQPANTVLGDMEDFQKAWRNNQVIRNKRKEYPEQNLYVDRIIFSIEDESLIACIMVDISHELIEKREFELLKNQTIQKVNEIVDNQMKVVQEIAGLLGETTAETKIGLLQIVRVLNSNIQ